jgi:EmrB/QacA subfamily drug resistance transporter
MSDLQSASGESGLAIDDPARGGNSRRWWILGVLGLGQLMVILDATIVNIALPSAQHALGFSISDRQWIVTAYALAFGGLLLLGGRLSDFFGRRRMFLIGVVGFGAASAVGGFSTGFPMLVAARGIQGAFGAMLAPAALSLLTTTFPDSRERGRAFGVFGAIAGAGGAIGLLLGGVLTEYLDWRWCLFVNCILAAAAVFGALALLTGQARARDVHFDIPGIVTAGVGLIGIVYGFSAADTKGWTSAVTLGCISAGVVLLAVFVLIERRSRFPLLPLRVVAHRTRGASYLAVAFVGISIFGVFLFLTYFMQQQLGYSPVRTGLAFLPMIAALVIASMLATTRILPRIGPKLTVVPGFVIAAGAMVYLTQLTLHASYLSTIVPALVLLGFGIGLVIGTSLNVATLGTTQEDAGIASAMVNTSQQVGGSIGTSLLNTVAASAAARYLVSHPMSPLTEGRAALHGDTVAFAVVACILLGGGAVTGLVHRNGRIAEAGQHAPQPT